MRLQGCRAACEGNLLKPGRGRGEVGVERPVCRGARVSRWCRETERWGGPGGGWTARGCWWRRWSGGDG